MGLRISKTKALKRYIILLSGIGLFLFFPRSFAQTKVGGIVTDEKGAPVPFANVVFTGSTEGTITDESGRFYLQSNKTYTKITVAFLGYKTVTVPVKPRDLHLKIVLKPEAQTLGDVKLYVGKPKNKGNPAVKILKKIWARKHRNGTRVFDYYEAEKYEKIEFDLYNVTEKLKKSRLFKGLEFVFNYVDTSRITGKPFLPVFINEALYKIYGRNIPPRKYREDLLAQKASGVENNEFVNMYLKDLYLQYDVYKNFIHVFGKDFVSPLSKLGPLTYYYVLSDTAQYNGITSYNIIFYPRRRGDLAFKGDMWIADSLWSVQNISMHISGKANVNWIKDFYLEQDFQRINDTVFVLKRDHITSQLGIENMDKATDILVKRTSIYDNYVFNRPHPPEFYDEETDIYDKKIYTKSDTFWQKTRPEKLNRNEKGIYQMLDSLQKTPKFKRMTDLATILGSGYAYIKYFDYGPVFSTVGYNDVEGIRLRVGGRTYFETNDLYRAEAYTAYGFRDKRFKYGLKLSGVLNIKPRVFAQAGYRNDVEQIGVSLTSLEDDVLSRDFASSSVFATGDKSKLTHVRIFDANIAFEPRKNIELSGGFHYKNLVSAHPRFHLDYIDKNGRIRTQVRQPEWYVQFKSTPGRKTVGYGVKRYDVNTDYPILLLRYTRGFDHGASDAFTYSKIQFYYSQYINIGAVGVSFVQAEAGKTFGKIPLALLNVVPGNQSFFYVKQSFQLLNYYEFITDTYLSFKWMHNFEGRIFSKIPLINRTKWRELVFFNSVWGDISPGSVQINASGIPYQTPNPVYFEYGAGITNILKFLEFDAFWRGNYRHRGGQDFFVKMNFRLNF